MCRLTCVLHEDSQPGEADVLLVVLGATFPHQILFPLHLSTGKQQKRRSLVQGSFRVGSYRHSENSRCFSEVDLLFC